MGIVELIVIFLSKVYYDPKHPAGFGSVTKLVEAGKNKKRCGRAVVKSKKRTLFTNLFLRSSREILTL